MELLLGINFELELVLKWGLGLEWDLFLKLVLVWQ
jgi:hypothetical protein